MGLVSDFRPGKKNQVSDDARLGEPSEFPDLDWSKSSVESQRLSQHVSKAILCKNGSNATTYTPGARVHWKASAGSVGRVTDAVAGADEVAAGIVDPWGDDIAPGDYYLLFIEGPTKVQYDGAANIAVNSLLGGAASGRVKVATVGTNDIATFGRADEAKSSGSAGDLVRAFVKFHL